MNEVKILEAAKAKIENKDNWTQGVFARNREGYNCHPDAPYAFLFCAVGAIKRVIFEYERAGQLDIGVIEAPAIRKLSEASNELYHLPTTQINDEFGHEAVMKVYDRAIEKAKENVL